jgi:hypothetical protein
VQYASKTHLVRVVPDPNFNIQRNMKYRIEVKATQGGAEWPTKLLDWTAPANPAGDYKILSLEESGIHVRHRANMDETVSLVVKTTDMGTLSLIFMDPASGQSTPLQSSTSQEHTFKIPIGTIPSGRWQFRFDGIRSSDLSNINDPTVHYVDIDLSTKLIGDLQMKLSGTQLTLAYALNRQVSHSVLLTSDVVQGMAVIFDTGEDKSRAPCTPNSDSCVYNATVQLAQITSNADVVSAIAAKKSIPVRITIQDKDNQATIASVKLDAIDLGFGTLPKLNDALTILGDKKNDKDDVKQKQAAESLKAALGPNATPDAVNNIVAFLKKNRGGGDKSSNTQTLTTVLSYVARAAGAYFGIPIPAPSPQSPVSTSVASNGP